MASQVTGYAGKYDPGNGTQYSLGSTAFAICETAANIAAKTADMTGFILMNGATIHVQFINDNIVEAPTLNINSTGAFAIKNYDNVVNSNIWKANTVISFTFKGIYESNSWTGEWIRDYASGIQKGYNEIINVPIASFNNGEDDARVKKLVININPEQSGSGDPSPTNVREISGWDSVSLGQTLAGYVMPTIEQGGINASGRETDYGNRCKSDYYPSPVVKPQKFIVAVQGDAYLGAIHFYDENKDWLGRVNLSGLPKVVTNSLWGDNTKYLRFVFTKADTAANIVPGDIENLVVAPYSSISLGQTVYGGTLRDNGDGTWTLTVTKAMKQVVSSDSNTFSGGVAAVPGFFEGLSISNPICSHFTYEAGTASDNTFYGVSSNRNLQIRSSAFSSRAEFNAFLEANTVQIVAGFPSSVTPQTYNLTAESVKTLLGNNNIFADCGDISLLQYYPNNAPVFHDELTSQVTRLENEYVKRSGDTITGTLQPGTTKVYDLGTPDKLWNNIYGTTVYGAVWNDYAEYRQSNIIEPGRCVTETGYDTLILTTSRLQSGCEIISDTFGFAIGETDKCKTPIAASGRVLAYPYESKEEFAKHIGEPVCSGPNGTVSIMTPEEEQKYPSRIIGTISAIPDYEEWGSGHVKVNGRVWIRIR